MFKTDGKKCGFRFLLEVIDGERIRVKNHQSEGRGERDKLLGLSVQHIDREIVKEIQHYVHVTSRRKQKP